MGLCDVPRLPGQKQPSWAISSPLWLQQSTTYFKTREQRSNVLWIFDVPSSPWLVSYLLVVSSNSVKKTLRAFLCNGANWTYCEMLILLFGYVSFGRFVCAGNIVIEIFVTVTWDASVCMNPTSRGCLAHGIWLELGIHTGHLVICWVKVVPENCLLLIR
jgi:hypothetical protein